jgi:hypothetical protein
MDLYDIGGFAGDVDAGQNVFINNYSVGTLSVSTNGIGGSIGGFMGYGSSDLFMTNNFRTGVMLVDVGVNEGDTIFGFAGNLDSSSVEVNNYLYHRSPTETAYATCGAAVNDEGGCTVATSETQFKNIENQPYIGATYDGDTYTWDIINDAPGEAIWFINSTLNDGFPCLYWEGMDCGTEDATPLPEVAPATVYGCMDPRAVNYNALATATNNACTYPVSAGGGRAWTPVSLPGTKPTDTPTTTLPGLIKALKLGNKTDQVKLLQQLLNKKGFTVAITGAGSSGSESILFGPKTKAAVIKFQKTNGLKPDGVVGPKTWAVLIK